MQTEITTRQDIRNMIDLADEETEAKIHKLVQAAIQEQEDKNAERELEEAAQQQTPRTEA